MSGRVGSEKNTDGQKACWGYCQKKERQGMGHSPCQSPFELRTDPLGISTSPGDDLSFKYEKSSDSVDQQFVHALVQFFQVEWFHQNCVSFDFSR